jgi:16S rRNA processing protein RimM
MAIIIKGKVPIYLKDVNMEKLKLGQIVSAVGLKGELKVYPFTDYRERFEELESLFVEDQLVQIEKVRYGNNNVVILKIRGVDDRTSAEKLRGRFLLIDRKNARELPEDTYFIGDLIGLTVVDDQDTIIGTLVEVIQNKSQDLYEIRTTKGITFLLPAVEEFVLAIDINARKMKIHVIEGLIS